MSIARLVNNIFYFYSIIIILRVFLTWIPTIDWQQQPFKAIREVSDAYLDIFKKLIPPFSGLDFSPIIALIVLQIVQVIATNIAASLVG